ncbi:MAG TPA: S8 family serine peptidase [Herpetosiphonaceae bacterium]
MKIVRRLSLLTLALALMFGVTPNLAGSVAQAETVPSVIDEQLRAVLTNATAPLQVVVTFKGDSAPTTAQIDLLRQLGISQGITFRSLPIAGVLATAAQVNALANHPEIRSLDLNYALSYDNYDATALTGVDRVRTDANMLRLNGGLPVTGNGVTVLVNDSGIDATHRDLQFGSHVVQNVEAALNLNALEPTLLPVTYVENVPNTDATGGHGTHVAGIVGGTGAMSNGKYEGVAPGADLIGYGSGAALLLLDTLGGFDYALTHQTQYGIRVVTNSWGNTGDVGTAFDPNDPINIATKRLYDRGIVVVFSAGNSGPDASTITGNFKKAPWVVTVAAGDKERQLADFSSRGTAGVGGSFTLDGQAWTWADRPTITAPGVNIISTRAASPIGAIGTPDDINLIEPAFLPFYTTLSGTSMAAPHVAGIVALMLDANPNLSPTQVKQILQETATPMSGYTTWEVGNGYVNAYTSVDRAFKTRTR